MPTARFTSASAAHLAVETALRRWARALGAPVWAVKCAAVAVPVGLVAVSAGLAVWTERQGVVAALGLPRYGIAAITILIALVTAGLVAIVTSYQATQSTSLPRTLGVLPATDRQIGAALAAMPGVIAVVKMVALLPLGTGLIVQDAGCSYWQAALAVVAAEITGTSLGRTLFAVLSGMIRAAGSTVAPNIPALALWCSFAAFAVVVFRSVAAAPDTLPLLSWGTLALWPVLLGPAAQGGTLAVAVVLVVALLAVTLDALCIGLTAKSVFVRRPGVEPRWLVLPVRARFPLFTVAALRLLRNGYTRNQLVANGLVLTGILAAVVLTGTEDRTSVAQTGLRASAFLAAQVAVASRGLWSRTQPHELVVGASLPAWVLGVWAANLAVALVSVIPHAVVYALWADDLTLLLAGLALTCFTVALATLYSFVVVPGAELNSGLAVGSLTVLLGITAGGALVAEGLSITSFLPAAGVLAVVGLLALPVLVLLERRRMASSFLVAPTGHAHAVG